VLDGVGVIARPQRIQGKAFSGMLAAAFM